MSANEGESRRSPGTALFYICVNLSGLVLGVSWLFVLVPPGWLINLANPLGWIACRVGLTSMISGLPGAFSGAESALRTPGGWIGFPVAGAFVLLGPTLVAFSRRHATVNIVSGLFAMIVLQFLMQDGLLSIAARARSKQAEASTDVELIRTEARALAGALEVSKLTGSPGVGYGADAFAPAARLYELAAKVDLSDVVGPPPAFEVSAGNIVLRFETAAPAFPLSFPMSKSAHFAGFERKMALAGQRIDFSALGAVNALEPVATLAMAAAIDIVIMKQFLEKVDPVLSAAIFSAENKVTIHLASVDTMPQNAHTTSVSGDVWARYDPVSKTISLLVEHTRYAKGMIAMLDTSLRYDSEAVRVDDKAVEHWGKDFTAPLTHELWHALAASVRGWADMPAAYDEGIAMWFQSLSERVTSAAVQNHAYTEAAMTPENTVRMASSMRANTSTTERLYLDLLAKAASEGRLVPVRDLLLLRNRFYDADRDTLLLRYAEAWAVAIRLITSPQLRETTFEALKKLEHRENLESEELNAWTTLDHDLISFPRDLLEGMTRGHE